MRIIFFTENSYAGGLDSIIIDLIDHWPDDSGQIGTPDELVLICNRSHPGLEIIARRINRRVEIISHDKPLHWELAAKVDDLPVPRIFKKIVTALSRYPFILYWWVAAKNLLKRQNADRLMVINGGYPAGDSCRAAAIAWARASNGNSSCVFGFHNFAVSPRWWENFAETFIDGLVERSCRDFVTVSRACAKSMDRRAKIGSSGKVRHILNGIRKPDVTSAEKFETICSEFQVADNAPLCLMLGTYEPRKGHEFLFTAFDKVLKSHPGAQLVICGYGYEKDFRKVSAIVEEMHLVDNVHLEGFRDDVAGLIDVADVLLVSSQAFESFGLTIVEAMARSTPVVATNIGGIPEVIGDDEGGYCVSANDAEGFAQRIISLLSDDNLRRQVGAAGYARYRKMFTAERMAEEYAAIIRNAA